MINQLKMRQESEEVLNAGRRRHVREVPREIHSTLLARRVPRGGKNIIIHIQIKIQIQILSPQM